VVERPGAGALVTALLAVALIGAWVMWQPLRSVQAMADAENHPATAFASARTAASRNPLSIEPLSQLSVLYQEANEPRAARAELVQATQLQPQNPQPWLWLGQLDLANGHPSDALVAMQQVFALNLPVDTTRLTANAVIIKAQAQLAARAARVKSQARRRARAARRAARRAGRPHTPR
jgi:Flp pilus assembly protein TadD